MSRASTFTLDRSPNQVMTHVQTRAFNYLNFSNNIYNGIRNASTPYVICTVCTYTVKKKQEFSYKYFYNKNFWCKTVVTMLSIFQKHLQGKVEEDFILLCLGVIDVLNCELSCRLPLLMFDICYFYLTIWLEFSHFLKTMSCVNVLPVHYSCLNLQDHNSPGRPAGAAISARLQGVSARLQGVSARLQGVSARLQGVSARLQDYLPGFRIICQAVGCICQAAGCIYQAVGCIYQAVGCICQAAG